MMIDEIEQREKALAELQRQEEIELFRYWLKMPKWGAHAAALMLAGRVSPDTPDIAHCEADAMELLVHFERFGLCRITQIEADFFGGASTNINGEHPPAEWIACYRNFPGFHPLPVEIEEALNQKPPSTVSEQKAVQVIAAMLAAWPGGKPPSDKDLERAAQAVGVSISDDTIRKALREARAIAPRMPPA